MRVGLDKQGLRLMAVSLPNSMTLGGLLADLGVASAASLGDGLTASGTTLIYVPEAADGTGG